MLLNQENLAAVCEEIFIQPSNEMRTDTNTNDAAPCNGECGSGRCQA